MKKEYLNEENYEAGKTKIIKISNIAFIIGIILIITGVFIVVSNGGIFDGDPFQSLGGISSIMFGVWIIGVGGITRLIAHRRKINAFFVQQNMPVAQETIEKITPTVAESIKEIKNAINDNDSEIHNTTSNETNVMFCSHCGKEIPSNSNFCKYCGKKIIQ